MKSCQELTRINEDQNVGIRILSRTLEKPLRQTVGNAGEDGCR